MNSAEAKSQPTKFAPFPVEISSTGNAKRIPFPPAAPPDTTDIPGPRELLELAVRIVRARWLVASIGAVVFMAGLAFLIFRRPVESTAETTLLAESNLDQILDVTSLLPHDQEHQENELNNHLSLMMSQTFRQRLVDSFSSAEKLAIQRPYLHRGTSPSDAFLTGVLARNIVIERERERDLFDIRVKHADPNLALLIADRFAETYLNFVQGELHRANQTAVDLLQKQSTALSAEIVQLEAELHEYRKKYNLVSIDSDNAIVEERLKRLNTALSEAQVRRSELAVQLAQVGTGGKAETAGPGINPILLGYGHNLDLLQQVDELRSQRDVLATRYGPNHPKLREAQVRYDTMKATLARNLDLALQDLQAQSDVQTKSIELLQSQIAAAIEESMELHRITGVYSALEGNIAGKRKALDELLQRLEKIKVDLHLPADLLRIVDHAYLRRGFLAPIYLDLIAILAFGGLGFVAVPFTLNFFDRSIKSSLDLEGTFHVPILGAAQKWTRVPRVDRAHIARDRTRPQYAEAFLNFSGQIDLVSEHRIPKRIIITSAVQGEGKSTVASNLAATLTRLGRRTLLIDADCRRPAQHGLHQIKSERGLVNWCSDGFRLSTDVTETNGPLGIVALTDGTFLLPAGGCDGQPARYLMAPAMSELFSRLGAQFDVIIVDTPPAGLFQDALILARYCDETVLVVRDGRAPVRLVGHVLADFAKTPAPVIGLFLNAFREATAQPHFSYRAKYAPIG